MKEKISKRSGVSDLSELKKNDIVSLDFGFGRVIARVAGNNGEFITWHSILWLESSAENYSYEQCKSARMTHVGVYRGFWERLLSLNFSKVSYIT